MKGGKPTCRTLLVNEHDYVIVNTFGAEYRGIVQYYLLAGNVHRLNRLNWVTQTSLLKTLARKHDSTVTKIAARHRAKIETPYGRVRATRSRLDAGKTGNHWSHGSAAFHYGDRGTRSFRTVFPVGQDIPVKS